MEQIVEYSNIKKLTDITKNFAEIPMTVVQDGEEVKFTIANFEDFYVTISNLLSSEYGQEIVITENNVATYEKEASEINKLKKQIKASATKFVDNFSVNLLGVTKGKNRKDGQVQVMEKLLDQYYNLIHKKTKDFRELKKVEEHKEEAIDVEVVEKKRPITTFIAEVPNEEVADFEEFCLNRKIILK